MLKSRNRIVICFGPSVRIHVNLKVLNLVVLETQSSPDWSCGQVLQDWLLDLLAVAAPADMLRLQAVARRSHCRPHGTPQLRRFRRSLRLLGYYKPGVIP